VRGRGGVGGGTGEDVGWWGGVDRGGGKWWVRKAQKEQGQVGWAVVVWVECVRCRVWGNGEGVCKQQQRVCVGVKRVCGATRVCGGVVCVL